jgi:hypothetical protein
LSELSRLPVLIYQRVSFSEERKEVHLACWDPNRGSNSCQENVAGDFSDHIAYCPGSGHVIQLIPIQSQVFFPALRQFFSRTQMKALETYIPETKALLIFDWSRYLIKYPIAGICQSHGSEAVAIGQMKVREVVFWFTYPAKQKSRSQHQP